MDSTLVILEAVEGFYNHAYTSLVVIVLGSMALVGVILPLANSWFQNRRFNEKLDSLKQENEAFVSDTVTEFRADMEKAVEEKLRETEGLLADVIDQQIAGAKGLIFHVQANTLEAYPYNWETKADS